ncbi:serine/threonine-protein phosphatase 2A activator [Drosophila bipectinata]|uniref:serine/threonine-protein phosphatase 2A activator n=1 Tax=Drosophila bipectinata TaxID=42026 RepID=UPI001C8A4045|nr:serine/threonine-protein phosphatase 2A activator [Drosophila bipectinata]
MNNKQVYDVTDPSVHALRTSAFMQNGPVKQVRGLEDLDRWVRSQAYYDTIAYISNTSMAIQGRRLTRDFPISEQMRKLCQIFDGLEHLLVEHSPKSEDFDASISISQIKSRAYRVWMRHMFQHVFFKLDEAIKAKCKHVNELGQYLRRSFGNATSLDFGPGNELMFLFFLSGLFRSEILLAKDTVAAALMLFGRYIHLVRRLVTTYALPIAKNPRCFIDDYYVLPYLWGAAQLSSEESFSPIQCEQPKIIENYRQDYMMMELIEHLQKTRGGQLSHVAFQLWCILSIPSWSQVYRGLERNYISHVLSSFETVENAIFCELMSFEALISPNPLARAYLNPYYNTYQENKEPTNQIENQAIDLKSISPVSLYLSMEPDIFLGYQNAKKHYNKKSSDSLENRLCMVRQVVDENDASSALFFAGQKNIQNESVNSSPNDHP